LLGSTGILFRHHADERQRELGRAVPGPPPEDLAQVLVWTAVHKYITAAALHEHAPDNRLIAGNQHLWSLAIYGRSRYSPELA
jgi:hypothetical protein